VEGVEVELGFWLGEEVPSARPPTLAASMTAIDPSTDLIQMAREHARMDPTVHEHSVEGSIAVIEAARVGVGAGPVGSSGIVRARDSAKMPPPQAAGAASSPSPSHAQSHSTQPAQPQPQPSPPQ
jgi:hypothetical protein